MNLKITIVEDCNNQVTELSQICNLGEGSARFLVTRLPFEQGVRRDRQQSPVMALELTDHLCSFLELLNSRVPTTS